MYTIFIVLRFAIFTVALNFEAAVHIDLDVIKKCILTYRGYSYIIQLDNDKLTMNFEQKGEIW
jgi:hypothetical protein